MVRPTQNDFSMVLRQVPFMLPARNVHEYKFSYSEKYLFIRI